MSLQTPLGASQESLEPHEPLGASQEFLEPQEPLGASQAFQGPPSGRLPEASAGLPGASQGTLGASQALPEASQALLWPLFPSRSLRLLGIGPRFLVIDWSLRSSWQKVRQHQ